MKRPLFIAAIALCSAVSALAADKAKVRKLDALESVDDSRRIANVFAKAVQTPDKTHSKVVELKFNYSKPGTGCAFAKDYANGFLNPRKFSGIQFWARSDNETSFGVHISGDYVRPDKKSTTFSCGVFKASRQWAQFVVPFDSMTRNGSQSGTMAKLARPALQGGDHPDAMDFAKLNNISFGSGNNHRGTDGAGHLMLHMLELIEK